jgi:hypothetical protein
MKKISGNKNELALDKDVETYLLKSWSDDNEKMSFYRQFIRKTFATGNAIYPLPRTIIQITNDNSIFCRGNSALTSHATANP